MAETKKVLLLTGASRGIGHATVKRFSAAGWRVLTVSRHAFSEYCPWEGGEKDHLQIDLADIEALPKAIEHIREKLNGAPLHALVNNAGVSPKGPDGARFNTQGRDCQCHLYCRRACPSLRRVRLWHIEGGAFGADAGVGGGFRPPWRARQCHCAGGD